MAGLDVDIKEVYIEIGSEIYVIGAGSGEYIDSEISAQATKPFIREFFLQTNFPYDTQASNGDIIEFLDSGDKFMMMNKTPDRFENEITEYDCVLYKCNVSGEILRASGEVWDSQSYHKVTIFDSVATNVYALQTEPRFGNDLITDDNQNEAPFGNITVDKEELYIPKSNDIQVNDRWQPTSGEYYRVDSIITRRYPEVNLVVLDEDNR